MLSHSEVLGLEIQHMNLDGTVHLQNPPPKSMSFLYTKHIHPHSSNPNFTHSEINCKSQISSKYHNQVWVRQIMTQLEAKCLCSCELMSQISYLLPKYNGGQAWDRELQFQREDSEVPSSLGLEDNPLLKAVLWAHQVMVPPSGPLRQQGSPEE